MHSALELGAGLLAEAGEAEVAGEGVQGEGGPGQQGEECGQQEAATDLQQWPASRWWWGASPPGNP